MSTSLSSRSPERIAGACPACGDTLRLLRHSSRWGVDVGGCRACGTLSVLSASAVVAADLEAARSEQTDWNVYAERMHLKEDIRVDVLNALRARVATGRETPVLFDVGAGTGAFLDLARGQGFGIRGNDISASAIAYAADRYAVELSSDQLEDQPADSVDALTMWCVLAHVGEPRVFLEAAWRMLRPGGVIFLRTPRLSRVDVVATVTARATGGRVSRLSDQRVTRGHLHLFSDHGMDRLLRGIGFDDVEIQPIVHSGCTGSEIATRLGGPERLRRVSGRAIDQLLARGRGPRNTMLVHARRPLRP